MFQDKVDSFISATYPRLKGIKASRGANLFSPVTIEIKKSDYRKVERAVKGFFSARNSLATKAVEFKPQNFSVCMSYDFHMTEQGPKLIEINTNAGQALYVDAIYRFKKEIPSYLSTPFLEALKDAFLSEASLAGISSDVSAAITDEDPEKQFFYPEFLMFADQMESWDWSPYVCDSSALTWKSDKLLCHGKKEINFVYNRLTDFYLEKHADLKSAHEASKICLSPNPFEYSLLADKNKLIEFSRPEILKQLVQDLEQLKACSEVLPKTYDVQKDSEKVLKERKNLFFKPKTSYAGKGAYRGESISKKVLEEILTSDYLAQEFIRPPEVEVDHDGKKGKFKYDVRFYVYKDVIQLVSARIYQGQVTNFRAPGAGICTVAVV